MNVTIIFNEIINGDFSNKQIRKIINLSNGYPEFINYKGNIYQKDFDRDFFTDKMRRQIFYRYVETFSLDESL